MNRSFCLSDSILILKPIENKNKKERCAYPVGNFWNACTIHFTSTASLIITLGISSCKNITVNEKGLVLCYHLTSHYMRQLLNVV